MGTYYRALDSKGRLLLPPRFIEALAGAAESAGHERPSCWLTMLYNRITGYLPEAWEETVAKLCAIPMPSRQLSNFKTRLIGMAHEIFPDAQGRVRIPQPLARCGNLQKDIVLAGLMDKFEIWDQGEFEAVPSEDVSAELAASGIVVNL
ncbi:MAG: division/cell wall cluster transcriptional repressor MraZ [Desulfovibrio sp.]|nr:division/cell wall cluster transcriptional repressor MraZ [Desulfovibrio sp.]